MKQIPSVDLGDFLSDDINKRNDFIENIGKAYEDIGFVALKGHFLDEDLVDELYNQVRYFFSLPNTYPIAKTHVYSTRTSIANILNYF